MGVGRQWFRGRFPMSGAVAIRPRNEYASRSHILRLSPDSVPAESIFTEVLPNGLTVLVEEMPDVRSASFALMVPAGALYEPAGSNGIAAALADWITRGAGKRPNRDLSSALDRLGVQRDEQVGWNFLTLSGATLADNLTATLEIYRDILLEPHLDDEFFEPVLIGVEQSLLAQEDDLQRKSFVELRKRCYDMPWGRPTDGSQSFEFHFGGDGKGTRRGNGFDQSSRGNDQLG